MALPIRCGKCRLWLAPQLTRCLRCGAKVPRLVAQGKAPADDADAATRRLDAKAKVLKATKLRWVIPLEAQKAHMATYLYLKKHGQKGTDAFKLSRHQALQSRDGAWSWGSETVRNHKLMIVISPKGNRYVLAHPHEYADLILVHTKEVDGDHVDRQGWKYARPVQTRLRRLEKSSLNKKLKKEQREDDARKDAKRRKKERKKQKKSDFELLANEIMYPTQPKRRKKLRHRRKSHA